MKARINGALKSVARAKVQIGSTLKPITRAAYYNGSALVDIATFIPPLSVTATSPVFGYGSTATLTSDPTTATPSGGSAPYTYAWTIIAGTATVNQPSSATTQFTQAGVPRDSTVGATARVTVTDASGLTASTTVALSFTRDSGGLPQN